MHSLSSSRLRTSNLVYSQFIRQDNPQCIYARVGYIPQGQSWRVPTKLSEELATHVSAILKERREHAGISHEKLAELANVHRTTVSRIESNSINGTFAVFASMAEALDVKLSDVIREAEKALKS